MAEPTKEELAAKAKQEAEAKARADTANRAHQGAQAQATPAAPDRDEILIGLTASVKNLEARTKMPGPMSAKPDLDKTVPGGKYLKGGVLVNAHGREINEDGTLKHPEQQRVNEFGQLV